MNTIENREWTVFYLVKSVDGTIGDLIRMLDQLMRVPVNDRIAIVLCINFNRDNLEAIMLQNPLLTQHDTNIPPSFTTMFFQVVAGINDDLNTLKIITEKADFDITEEADLAGYFFNRIRPLFVANRYMLFTWDHGNGYRIFSGDQRGTALAVEPGLLTLNEEATALTMEELAQAIAWGFDSEKLELIIMMNCNMQVFDSAFALRDCAKFLIAPQTLMGFMDYAYRELFTSLARCPWISARDLAAQVIQFFKMREYKGETPYLAVSACRLKYIDMMSVYMDDLADKLRARLLHDADYILLAFRNASSVDGLNLIDLFSLFSEIDKIATPAEKGLIGALFSLKDECIYKHFAGAQLKNNECSGISIKNPLDRPRPTFFKAGPSLSNESLFIQTTQWGLLYQEIKIYAQRLPRPVQALGRCGVASGRFE